MLLLAHGAGAGMDTPFLTTFADALLAERISVVRFDFPYMERRKRLSKVLPPDRMPLLEQHFRELVERTGKQPLFVGGKSMGARVAVQIADDVGARGVIALGFPFHPPGKTMGPRLPPLRALQAPALIVQGERDPFGTREELASETLPKNIALHWLADGDHSFVPRRRSGRTLLQNLAEAAEAAARFVNSHS